jgi:simple sugar transport system permease protein
MFAGGALIAASDSDVIGEVGRAVGRLTPGRIAKSLVAILMAIGGSWCYLSQRFRGAMRYGRNIEWIVRLGGLVIGPLLAAFLLAQAGFDGVFVGAVRSALAAYRSMFEGALGNPAAILAALQSGSFGGVVEAFNPLSESLVTAAPYVFSGLSVAVGLRCGLFNIGAEGQLFVGAICSVVTGYAVKGLPPILHVPLALGMGAFGGALWAAIPGILKGRYGSNEVINTIMLNYVAFRLTEWLLSGPIRRPGESMPFSQVIEPSAELTRMLPYPSRLHLGVFLALGAAALLCWFLFRTTYGLEIRLVGQNPNAAKCGGINLPRTYLIAFCISGALAGLAGANEILGMSHCLSNAISPGYGFESISLSILGGNHPIGVVLASLLFGALRSGATHMQNIARIPLEIITVVQALVIALIAAPRIVQTVFHIGGKAGERLVLTRGWGR